MVAVVDSGEKWGIIMLMGEFHHTIDEKGRIIIPSKFRDEIGNSFIITRGIDYCLFCYSIDTFNKISNNIRVINNKDSFIFYYYWFLQ